MKTGRSTQIVFRTTNQVGQLAEILGIVGDADVNILAYSGFAEGREGVIRMVTEENGRIADFLEDAGYQTRQEPVLVVREQDEVGCGAELARRIARANVNITCVYATSVVGGDYITVYQADDLDALEAALR